MRTWAALPGPRVTIRSGTPSAVTSATAVKESVCAASFAGPALIPVAQPGKVRADRPLTDSLGPAVNDGASLTGVTVRLAAVPLLSPVPDESSDAWAVNPNVPVLEL